MGPRIMGWNALEVDVGGNRWFGGGCDTETVGSGGEPGGGAM
jgi:hypothetical protein